MSFATTAAPSATNRWTIAEPIPPAAPVTKAVFPCSLADILLKRTRTSMFVSDSWQARIRGESVMRQQGLKQGWTGGPDRCVGAGPVGLVSPALLRRSELTSRRNRRPETSRQVRARQEEVRELKPRIPSRNLRHLPGEAPTPSHKAAGETLGLRGDGCHGSRRSATSARCRDRNCVSSTTLRKANLANCGSMTRPPGGLRQATREQQVCLAPE